MARKFQGLKSKRINKFLLNTIFHDMIVEVMYLDISIISLTIILSYITLHINRDVAAT